MAMDVEPEPDLDPLAPVIYDDPVPETVLSDDPDDGGVSDSENIVRVWLSEGRLTRVRVSPVWYSRLGRRSLSDCFAQALRMANAAIGEVPARPEPSFSEADLDGLPPFTPRTFAAVQALFDEVETRWEEAIERHHTRPRTAPTVVEGRSKGVTVTLNEIGLADGVRFDDKWLEDAQAGAICAHVQQAADTAYARFVPAREDRAELEAIEEEHQFLMAALKAMLDPKER